MSEGTVISCDGSECVPDTVGDGTCDPALACLPYGNDGDDCCPEGQIKNCDGGCNSQSWLADGFCDAAFNCKEFAYDEGLSHSCGTGNATG